MADDSYSVRINRRDGVVEITGPDKDWIAEQVGRLSVVYGRPLEEEQPPSADETRNPPKREDTTKELKERPARAKRSGSSRASRNETLAAKLTPDVKEKLQAFRAEREANFKRHADQVAIVATFLQDELAHPRVDKDDLYTVYSVMGWPGPTDFRSALTNARSREKYFGGQVEGKSELAHKGEQFGRIDSKGTRRR